MGDAGGKLADGREPVGMAQLILQACLVLIGLPPMDNKADLPGNRINQASLFL
ncbi:MAG: hypothetical protein ACYTF1_06265 [Planctomycetota bacterium]|jgi:hypothetical protein